jgi:hypothetical protein
MSTIQLEMTALRLLPLPMHAALEMLLGLALLGVPFALGLSTAALAAGVVIGALVVGHALKMVDADRTTSVAAHHAADHGVALGMAGAAAVLAAIDPAAAVLFGAAAALQLVLNLTTRYTAR